MKLDNYLASDERLLLSFSALNVDRGDEEATSTSFASSQNIPDYQVGATDRRIVYLTSSGDFKDIDYNHISSIETETGEDENVAPFALGCCGGVLLLSGIGSFIDSPGMGLFGLLVGGVILYAAAKWHESLNAIEKQKIKFITGDEAHQKIEVTIEKDEDKHIGPELSRILREHRW